jgi:hypothetical protein
MGEYAKSTLRTSNTPSALQIRPKSKKFKKSYLFKVHFVRMRTEEFYSLKGIYLADGVAITEAVVVVPAGSQSHHEVRTSKITRLTSELEFFLCTGDQHYIP